MAQGPRWKKPDRRLPVQRVAAGLPSAPETRYRDDGCASDRQHGTWPVWRTAPTLRRYEFQFVMARLVVIRGTACPVNPIAVF